MSADPRVMEFFPQTYNREESRQMATRMRTNLEQDGYGWWVVEVVHGPAFAGLACLQKVPFEAPFTPATEIGWRFVHSQWGHGYATEAARALLDFAFTELGWNEIVAFTAAINERSLRVMQRLGMTHDPADDFDHPRLPPGHRLQRHVLYRISAEM